MRRHITSALLLTALVMGTTGCRDVFDDGGGQQPPVERTAAAERAATDQKGRKAVAWVGDSVDIGGRAFGEHVRISVLGFVDPAIGTRATARQPADGYRRIGVDVTLANVGGRSYDASRAKAWVVDGAGKSYPAVPTERITTGSPLTWNTVAAGEQSQGWLVFEVPDTAVILRLHCTLGTATIGWQLQFPPSR